MCFSAVVTGAAGPVVTGTLKGIVPEVLGRAAPERVRADADLPRPHPFVSFHRYYVNLCQKIHKGPLDCSDRASICKKSSSGDVQVLGLVHTQKLDVQGKAWVLVTRVQVPCLSGRAAYPSGRAGPAWLWVKLRAPVPGPALRQPLERSDTRYFAFPHDSL